MSRRERKKKKKRDGRWSREKKEYFLAVWRHSPVSAAETAGQSATAHVIADGIWTNQRLFLSWRWLMSGGKLQIQIKYTKYHGWPLMALAKGMC